MREAKKKKKKLVSNTHITHTGTCARRRTERTAAAGGENRIRLIGSFIMKPMLSRAPVVYDAPFCRYLVVQTTKIKKIIK